MPLQPRELEIYTRSDEFHNSRLIGAPDDALNYALKMSAENNLPNIAVAPAHGKLLHLYARAMGAKRILEIGTLGGYSAIWMARALPEDGELITLELEEKCAKVAQGNIDHAGLTSKVKIIVGPAAESLANLPSERKFDFVFIDADKPNTLPYFLEAERLVKQGGVIFVDNAVQGGRVADPDDTDDFVVGVRKLVDHLKTDKNVDATTIATVCAKAHDGFIYAVRL